VFCATTIVSILTTTLALVLGIVAVKQEEALGLAGIILAIVAGIMMLLLVLVVVTTGRL
jgi:hypothetical protein